MIVDLIANPDYRFLEDSYYATGGFKDGEYIVKRPRESVDNYNVRKQLSYYLNYVKPVIDSHVNPIFRTDASRDWGGRKENNGSNLFSLFYENVDTVKTKLPKFMKRAARIAKLHGAAFIVVDNVSDQPGSMAEVLKTRAFPYAYIVKPHQVTDYTVNKAGALTSITYTIAGDNSGSNGKSKEVWTWTQSTWKCSGQDTTEKTGPNLIHKVPVVVLLGAEADPGELKPQSEFYSIAKTNKRIYNLCSEIDEIITKQTFSILTYPMGPSADQDKVKEMLTGTENAVCYDGTVSNSPAYISPDSAPLEQLRLERKELVQEIYRMAQQSHVTGVETKASGVAKSWDFEQTNQTLADFANNCEAAEYGIAELFGLWTKAEVYYQSKYSDDFGIVDIVSELDGVGKALDLNIGGRFNTAVKKKAVDVYLNDLPEDEFDAVVDDIDATAKDETYKFDGDSVTSAVEILTAVASKAIAPEAAVIMMQAFFGMTEEIAKSLLAAQEKVIGLGGEANATNQTPVPATTTQVA
ncbi:hypothetical protein [Pelosinus fermentans]|uniref:Uncharacterized protein n=1 Tax=Pelosinus fermentans JBW45 TaxID=1192197 RepID=I9NM79_9FIRM|nr:hypothetical protein [Pelosinus fermentans]AJQ26908.1 hypothetical protein JBW_01558 [Pelosinus fermentans JBW45]